MITIDLHDFYPHEPKGSLIEVTEKEPVFTCKHSRVDESMQCHGLQILESELEELLYQIISKQAEIILNIEDVVNLKEYDVQLASKVECEKRIRAIGDRKRGLYEQFLSKEVGIDEYKALKAEYDDEINNLNRAFSSMALSVSQIRLDNTEKTKVQKLAREIKSESKLTRPLVDKLIEKVHISPGNRIEVDWKIKDFAAPLPKN